MGARDGPSDTWQLDRRLKLLRCLPEVRCPAHEHSRSRHGESRRCLAVHLRQVRGEVVTTYKQLVAECEADRDALAAALAGCKQQLALAPTYEKMMAQGGSQAALVRELAEALRLAESYMFSDDGRPIANSDHLEFVQTVLAKVPA